ncbi:complexin-2 [Ruminococcus sp. OM05-7]|nr:complexin-2 [Ruminococcus sp. OM05-7]
MIPEELFGKIIKYHLLDREQEADDIRKGLEKKLDAMVNREVYSKFKTAPTEEERKKFRQEYLDRKGMQESFRW